MELGEAAAARLKAILNALPASVEWPFFVALARLAL
jgi:hypothetical protein